MNDDYRVDDELISVLYIFLNEWVKNYKLAIDLKKKTQEFPPRKIFQLFGVVNSL